MNFSGLTDWLGDAGTAALGGFVIGLAFGVFAQRSQFCLRSATIEFWRGSIGPKTAVWLLTFAAAVLGTQWLIWSENLDATVVRQLSTPGTMSGASLGGCLFGIGMILARGCASRLLVLSATGNLRALIAGLVLTVVAQASLRGVLSPVRIELSEIWTVGAETRDMLAGAPAITGPAIGLAFLAAGLGLARYRRLPAWIAFCALGVGAAVAGGWWFTSILSQQAFEMVPVKSISFTGPSADTLMALMHQPDMPLDFDLGLVPGVFAGSFLAATVTGDFRVQTFDGEVGVMRYLVGASLMGFGGMLAGGCAVGAGVTGGAVFALTAWVALTAMWASAGLTDYLLDRPRDEGLSSEAHFS